MVFVTEVDRGERLGFATLGHTTHFTGERQASINELASSEVAEGRGVGAALIAACEQWAREQGYRILALSRFIRAQEGAELAFPAYAQAHWVKAQGYAERPWLELVELWRLYNCPVAHVIRLIPVEKLAAPCVIGSDEPVMLGYLVENYLIHLRQHLHELE